MNRFSLVVLFTMVAAPTSAAEPPRLGDPPDFQLPERSTLRLANGLEATFMLLTPE